MGEAATDGQSRKIEQGHGEDFILFRYLFFTYLDFDTLRFYSK